MSAPLFRHLFVFAIAVCGLSACATVNRLSGDVRPFEEPVVPNVIAPSGPLPVAALASGDGGGSIYGARSGRGMSLFQDNKASDVGDLLTIALVESTTATTQSKTAVNKKSGLDFGIPTLGGAAVPGLGASLEGGRTFAGDGNSAQSNKLVGQLTVRVVQDLGNGNLLVRGDKQIRLNQGDELVQIQGIVRRADITADNRVTSDRVADARIVYGGRGTLARSNAMGWLSRFFNSALYPY
ncbi:MAG: flagellar basal body L-ring protein FlgH [Thermomonas sp.]|jgi:flagellar L-ring protein precursor FlgH|uniref:flagellar basal body L-ring protein FlgH n=1 Tax=Thermomonas sp. TaxID=1971895 RepID=UPI001ECDBB90|nr:flagellar basal body L-ring protein FlgH [Thermomonas sp.]MBV2209577.1 flagellar basal body L-ring protein FlgH [Thermomonas sp.]